MEVKATLDMTIPLWGILVSLMTGVYYIIKLSFDVNKLKVDVEELKSFLNPKRK